MDFDKWIAACRKIAAEKGLNVPTDMEEDTLFDWKNQFNNSMSPEEAVYYFMQNAGEG